MYYGGEIGMGGGEHSNRQCMIWEKIRTESGIVSICTGNDRIEKRA